MMATTRNSGMKARTTMNKLNSGASSLRIATLGHYEKGIDMRKDR